MTCIYYLLFVYFSSNKVITYHIRILTGCPEPPQLTPFDAEKQRLSSLFYHSGPERCPHYYWWSPNLSISRCLSLDNKIPRCLNSFVWGRYSSPTRKERSTFFRLRTMASDLEELTFILASSHSATKCSNAHWSSWLEGANRTTSSAKSRNAILRFQKPDILLSPTTAQDPVRKSHQQDLWQGTALADSNTYCKWVRPSVNNRNTAFDLVIQRPNSFGKSNSGTPQSRCTSNRTPLGTRALAFSNSTKDM